MAKKLKICLACSAGGHLSQLLKLSDCFAQHEKIWITTSNLVQNQLQQYGPVYIAAESNRRHPLKILKTIIYCAWIIFKNKPNVVISTGAAVGFAASLWGKLSGAKIIWIDSITNTKKLSLSGKLVSFFADLLLVQWPDLTKIYPHSEYAGTLV